MTAEKFWTYIELVQDKLPKFHNNRAYESYQTQLIKQALLKQSFQEVVNFNIAYTKKVDELFLPNVVELYAVSYLSFEELKDGQAYISNDGFRDFRNWVIGLGRADYQLIKNFTKEEEVLHLDFYVEHAYRSDLEFIINDLYKEFYAELKDAEVDKMYENRFSGVYFADFGAISAKINWANLDKKYPKIFAQYAK